MDYFTTFTTVFAPLGGGFVLIAIYYYYVKQNLRTKVRVAIQDPNKKIKYYNVKILDGGFKLGEHTYTWNSLTNDGETEFQILPGLYETMKYGQYIRGRTSPVKYSDGKHSDSVSGAVFTEIVENDAIKKFLAGFGRIDNETLLRAMLMGTGVTVIAVVALAQYIKPLF